MTKIQNKSFSLNKGMVKPMKHVWSIFKQDLKNIRRVPLIAILLGALCVLPSLYAWFNLSATWDPYANTGGIKIAVVNEDEGTTVNGQVINVGDELVHHLKENEQLGWTFVDKEEAKDGVRTGRFYAAIYIDKYFSKNLTSFLSSEPEQAKVYYEVNEKKNAIAPKMTSAGATTIVQKISDEFIETTSHALFSQLNKASIKLEEELPRLHKIKLLIFELENRLPAIHKLGDKIIEIDDNWETIEDKINMFLSIQDYLPEIHEKTNQLLKLQDSLPKIKEISDAVLEYEPYIDQLENFAAKPMDTSTAFTTIDEYMNKSINEMNELQNKINELQQNIISLENKMNDTQTNIHELQSILQEIETIIDPLIDIIIAETGNLYETTNKIIPLLEKIENEKLIEETYDTLVVLNERIKIPLAILNRSIEMLNGLNELLPSKPLSPMIEKLTTMEKNVQKLKTTLEAIIDAIQTNQLSSEKIAEWQQKIENIKKITYELNQFLSTGGKEQIIQFIQSLNKKIEDANSLLHHANQITTILKNFLNNAQTIVNKAIEATETLQKGLPKFENDLTIALTNAQEEIKNMTKNYHQLASFIKNDLPKIETAYYKVAHFIDKDFPKIEQEYKQLADNIETNLPKIEKTVHELANITRERFPAMEEQIQRLANKLRELENNENLEELVSLLKNDANKESEFFSHPVRLVEEKLYPIPNYGSANAPFYTTLSLWVGALLLSNLLSTEVHKHDFKPEYSHWHIYLGRLILFLIIGILQGLIVSSGDLLILGVYAAHPIWFILFSLFIAFVFMTIVYTFASLLGNIGKGLAIIFLVLQLSSSGGTFPVEVIPPFFQALHPYLPFTYAINLLREAVGGIYKAQVWQSIFALLGFWLLFITLGLLLKKPLTKRMLKTAKKTKLSRLVD